jgi:hypothetical protein
MEDNDASVAPAASAEPGKPAALSSSDVTAVVAAGGELATDVAAVVAAPGVFDKGEAILRLLGHLLAVAPLANRVRREAEALYAQICAK